MPGLPRRIEDCIQFDAKYITLVAERRRDSNVTCVHRVLPDANAPLEFSGTLSAMISIATKVRSCMRVDGKWCRFEFVSIIAVACFGGDWRGAMQATPLAGLARSSDAATPLAGLAHSSDASAVSDVDEELSNL